MLRARGDSLAGHGLARRFPAVIVRTQPAGARARRRCAHARWWRSEVRHNLVCACDSLAPRALSNLAACGPARRVCGDPPQERDRRRERLESPAGLSRQRPAGVIWAGCGVKYAGAFACRSAANGHRRQQRRRLRRPRARSRQRARRSVLSLDRREASPAADGALFRVRRKGDLTAVGPAPVPCAAAPLLTCRSMCPPRQAGSGSPSDLILHAGGYAPARATCNSQAGGWPALAPRSAFRAGRAGTVVCAVGAWRRAYSRREGGGESLPPGRCGRSRVGQTPPRGAGELEGARPLTYVRMCAGKSSSTCRTMFHAQTGARPAARANRSVEQMSTSAYTRTGMGPTGKTMRQHQRPHSHGLVTPARRPLRSDDALPRRRLHRLPSARLPGLRVGELYGRSKRCRAQAWHAATASSLRDPSGDLRVPSAYPFRGNPSGRPRSASA